MPEDTLSNGIPEYPQSGHKEIGLLVAPAAYKIEKVGEENIRIASMKGSTKTPARVLVTNAGIRQTKKKPIAFLKPSQKKNETLDYTSAGAKDKTATGKHWAQVHQSPSRENGSASRLSGGGDRDSSGGDQVSGGGDRVSGDGDRVSDGGRQVKDVGSQISGGLSWVVGGGSLVIGGDRVSERNRVAGRNTHNTGKGGGGCKEPIGRGGKGYRTFLKGGGGENESERKGGTDSKGLHAAVDSSQINAIKHRRPIKVRDDKSQTGTG